MYLSAERNPGKTNCTYHILQRKAAYSSTINTECSIHSFVYTSPVNNVRIQVLRTFNTYVRSAARLAFCSLLSLIMLPAVLIWIGKKKQLTFVEAISERCVQKWDFLRSDSAMFYSWTYILGHSLPTAAPSSTSSNPCIRVLDFVWLSKRFSASNVVFDQRASSRMSTD